MVAVWVRWLGVGAGSLVSTSCRTRLSHIRLDHVRILIEGKISESQSWEELPESAIAYKGHTDQRPREESDLEAAQAVAAVPFLSGAEITFCAVIIIAHYDPSFASRIVPRARGSQILPS